MRGNLQRPGNELNWELRKIFREAIRRKLSPKEKN